MLSSLRFRLPFALVGLAVVSAGVMGVVGWSGSRSALDREAVERLQQAAAAREVSLDLVAERLDVDLAAMAVDRMIGGNLGDLDENLVPSKPDFAKVVEAFTTGSPEERLAQDGAKIGGVYGVRHARVHQAAVPLMKTGGYADIILLNKDGRVVYTATKSSDFGRDPTDSGLAASGLGRLFEAMKSRPDGEATFEDFAPYTPAGDAPAAFLGRPVLKRANVAMGEAQNAIRAGYVVVRLGPGVFDRVLTDRQGMGTTGQTFAVGPDGVLRSNAPLVGIPTAGRPVADLGIGKPVTIGGTVLHYLRDGENRLGATAETHMFGRKWIVVAEKSVAESLAGAEAIRSTMQFVGAVILIATILIGVLVARSITGPILRLTDALRAIAGGRLDAEIKGRDRRDEIGEIARAVETIKVATEEQAAARAATAERERETRETERRQMTASLARDFEARVGGVAQAVGRAAVDLEKAAADMARLARQSADQSATVSDASQGASGDVRSVAVASDQLFSSIRHVSELIGRSGAIAGEADRHAQATNSVVRSLAETADRIGSVVDIIQSIAEQTNLLALNATIEAARAGESGRGFAVVAAEVKNLAGQTAKATEEISGQIAAMRQATQTAVDAIGRIRTVVGDIGSAVGSVAQAVEEQTGATSEIARSAQNASQGTEIVSANIAEVRTAVVSTESAADGVVNQARRLGQEAKDLQDGLRRFVAQLEAA